MIKEHSPFIQIKIFFVQKKKGKQPSLQFYGIFYMVKTIPPLQRNGMTAIPKRAKQSVENILLHLS